MKTSITIKHSNSSLATQIASENQTSSDIQTSSLEILIFLGFIILFLLWAFDLIFGSDRNSNNKQRRNNSYSHNHDTGWWNNDSSNSSSSLSSYDSGSTCDGGFGGGSSDGGGAGDDF